ncbi:hypothetical protein YTXLTZUM_CDS0160 [Enterococcus phage VRE9_3]
MRVFILTLRVFEGFHFNIEDFHSNTRIFRHSRIIFRIFSRLMCPLG